MMCMNSCQPELTTSVPHPFPAPYERCETSLPGGGTFSVLATNAARTNDPQSGAATCCYRFSNRHPPLGRPFRDGDALRVAARAHRADWKADLAPSVEGLTQDERRSLADAWARDAASEHASVAAFARFALQLLAVGAPADLLEAAHEAALDEIAHARVSYAIASAYAGEAIGPAPLAMASSSIQTSLATMAVETFLDGCIAETRAAIVARDKAATSSDPIVRGVLTTIADDEERHAELAWRTVAWALRTGGDDVRDAIAAAAATAFASGADDDVLREVVRPCIEASLAFENA
jgi:hypothetical protein